jgi:hypothetical protein
MCGRFTRNYLSQLHSSGARRHSRLAESQHRVHRASDAKLRFHTTALWSLQRMITNPADAGYITNFVIMKLSLRVMLCRNQEQVAFYRDEMLR